MCGREGSVCGREGRWGCLLVAQLEVGEFAPGQRGALEGREGLVEVRGGGSVRVRGGSVWEERDEKRGPIMAFLQAHLLVPFPFPPSPPSLPGTIHTCSYHRNHHRKPAAVASPT